MKKFKVGDRVKFRLNGKKTKGKIISIKELEKYPIAVDVDNGSIIWFNPKDGILKHFLSKPKKEKSLVQKLAKCMEKRNKVTSYYDEDNGTVSDPFPCTILSVGNNVCQVQIENGCVITISNDKIRMEKYLAENESKRLSSVFQDD